MRLIQRFRQLTLWNKIGLIGAIASVIGLALVVYSSMRFGGPTTSDGSARAVQVLSGSGNVQAQGGQVTINVSRDSLEPPSLKTDRPTWLVNRPPPGETQFLVENHYAPTGKLGDIRDVEISSVASGKTRFSYEMQGRSPHEWEWKYLNNIENPEAARFAGVLYLHPPNNFGSQPGGWDLRGAKRICWEGRSLDGIATVVFVIGGVRWQWAHQNGRWVQQPVPYRDSMPRISLGSRRLTESWQEFSVSLDSLTGISDETLSCVVAAFGWTASWPDNNISGDISSLPDRTITFELRRIRYEW